MSWRMNDGTWIEVVDMDDHHVEATLRMLIWKYTKMCLTHGARYTSQIQLKNMTDEAKREMLTQTCRDRKFLKRRIIKDCFQPTRDELAQLDTLY